MSSHGTSAAQMDAARYHVLFHHNPADTDGWITMAKKDPHTQKFTQYHYKPEELAGALSEWMGEDIYFSQNTFYKPRRRIDHIRQLRSIYVDLDVYNLSMDPRWVLGKLEHEYFRDKIPEPNMVVFSGRGLVLIWHIDPIPHMAMPLWRAVENYLMDTLKDLGADSKATDPTRIFRLAGTINSKSGTMVKAEYRHSYKYDIHDIQYDYLPELTPKPQTAKKQGRKSRVIRLFNIYTLHIARARDIAKLVELREGNVTSYRENICFLYRYFTCCFTSDPEKALEDTLDLNSEFTAPLPQREVIKATKSAQKAWEAKSDAKADAAAKLLGYPGAGYNLKNSKIIEWLDITPEEQTHLSTIIGAQEKRRRNTERMRKVRREAGMSTMAEYNKARSSAVQDKVEILAGLLADNPKLTNQQAADKMGVSLRTLKRLKQKLQ